jgi:glucosamine 6-phosphate synthetase-like amidotransferase/phosphosugar isomerase protein
MCGIAGFIGKSKNNTLSFELLSELFERLDSRGIDASGYWLAESGDDGSVYTHKQPGRSSEFINSDIWKSNKNVEVNLALVHARGASRGSGNPLVNKNNHPFLSEKSNIALIHNGRIDEYDSLKKKYNVHSQCDSEILLRIFEQAKHQYSENFLNEYVGILPERERMAGIKDIFSYVTQGHMAVAIGEWKNNNGRNLWLFRNEHRPLWIADARNNLGQIFFFSDPLIWKSAANALGDKSIINSKIIEVIDHEIWHFSLDSEKQNITYPNKYYVTSSECKEWSYSGNALSLAKDDIEVNIITPLSTGEDYVYVPATDDDADKLLDEMEKKIEKIQETCRNIYANSQVLLRNNSISVSDVEQILSLLDEQKKSFLDIENIFD